MPSEKRDQVRFFLCAEREAEGILTVGHEPAGFDRILIERLLKRIQIDPFADVRRHRQRFEFQAFQRL